MKHIGDIDLTALSSVREDKEYTSTLNPLAAQLVDQIFVKMALLCRGFDSFYADRNRLNAEKTQWILAFSKNGIFSKNQIQPAVNKLEFYRYPNPPQLGEFLSWAKTSPEDIGFPSPDEAYILSVKMNTQFSDYRHPDDRVDAVIRHAISQIGSMSYREMKIDNSKKTFKTYYDISLRQFMDGNLEVIPKALPEKVALRAVNNPGSNDARLKAMQAMRGMGFNVKPHE